MANSLGDIFGQPPEEQSSQGTTLGELLGRNQQSVGRESSMSQQVQPSYPAPQRAPSAAPIKGQMVGKNTALVNVDYPDSEAALDDLFKEDASQNNGPIPQKEAGIWDRLQASMAVTEQGKVNIYNKKGIPAMLVDGEAHYANGSGPIDKTDFDIMDIPGDIADFGGDAFQAAATGAGAAGAAAMSGGNPVAVMGGMAAGEMAGTAARGVIARDILGAGPGETKDIHGRMAFNLLVQGATHVVSAAGSKLVDIGKQVANSKMRPIFQVAKVSEATGQIVKDIAVDTDMSKISKELMEQNSAVRLAKGEEVSKMKNVALGLAGEKKLDDGKYSAQLKKMLDEHNVGFDNEGFALRQFDEVPSTRDTTYGVPKFGSKTKSPSYMASENLPNTYIYNPEPTEKMLAPPIRNTDEVGYPVNLEKETRRGGSKVVGYRPAEFDKINLDKTKDVLARGNMVDELIGEYNEVLKAKKTYGGRNLDEILAGDRKMEEQLKMTLASKNSTPSEIDFRTKMADATRDHKDGMLEWLLGNDPVYDGKVKAINGDFSKNVAKLDAITAYYETSVNKNGTMMVRGVVDQPQNHQMLDTLFNQMSPDQFKRFRGAYLDDVLTRNKTVAGYTNAKNAYAHIKNLPPKTRDLLFQPGELRRLEKAYIDFDKINFTNFTENDQTLLTDAIRVGRTVGIKPETWSRMLFDVVPDAHAGEKIAEYGLPALAKMADTIDERIYTRTVGDHFRRIMNYAGRSKSGKAQRLFLGPEARSFYLSNIGKPTYDYSAEENQSK